MKGASILVVLLASTLTTSNSNSSDICTVPGKVPTRGYTISITYFKESLDLNEMREKCCQLCGEYNRNPPSNGLTCKSFYYRQSFRHNNESGKGCRAKCVLRESIAWADQLTDKGDKSDHYSYAIPNIGQDNCMEFEIFGSEHIGKGCNVEQCGDSCSCSQLNCLAKGYHFCGTKHDERHVECMCYDEYEKDVEKDGQLISCNCPEGFSPRDDTRPLLGCVVNVCCISSMDPRFLKEEENQRTAKRICNEDNPFWNGLLTFKNEHQYNGFINSSKYDFFMWKRQHWVGLEFSNESWRWSGFDNPKDGEDSDSGGNWGHFKWAYGYPEQDHQCAYIWQGELYSDTCEAKERHFFCHVVCPPDRCGTENVTIFGITITVQQYTLDQVMDKLFTQMGQNKQHIRNAENAIKAMLASFDMNMDGVVSVIVSEAEKLWNRAWDPFNRSSNNCFMTYGEYFSKVLELGKDKTWENTGIHGWRLVAGDDLEIQVEEGELILADCLSPETTIQSYQFKILFSVAFFAADSNQQIPGAAECQFYNNGCLDFNITFTELSEFACLQDAIVRGGLTGSLCGTAEVDSEQIG